MSSQKPLPKIEYKKILYVTDLSESGRQAFPHAFAIAHRNNAQLTVFHVVDNGNLQSLEGYISNELWEELTSQSLENARKTLLSRKRENLAIENVEQFCQDYLSDQPEHPDLSYEVKVEVGERLDEILEEAHGGGYDLLVISKHGNRASVKDAIIGDTTRRIIRRCRIPVMVIPLNE
jgi:nucleotide-binding universal stress UspA family protein